MKFKSKRFRLATSLIEKDTFHTIEDAINLVKKTSTVQFLESVEVHFVLNTSLKSKIKPGKYSLSLPYGTGKSKKIAVLAPRKELDKFIDIRPDITGDDDLIDIIRNNNINFDILLTVPSMMPKLAKFGKILGPKNLMPSYKTRTLTDDIVNTYDEFKNQGRVDFQVTKNGTITLIIGNKNFSDIKLIKNFLNLYKFILSLEFINFKRKNIRKCSVCSSMGPSISIDLESINTEDL